MLPDVSEGRPIPWWSLRGQRAGAGATIAIVLIVGVSVWYAIDSRNNTPPAVAAATTATAKGPVAASPADLTALAASLGHPVYWAGPRPDTTLELTVSSGGQVYVRYLPKGVPIGATQLYLTVATYPVPNAFGVTKAALTSADVKLAAPHGGVGGYPSGQGADVHLAFPGGDVQIEVFDPSSAALPAKLVTSGAIVPA